MHSRDPTHSTTYGGGQQEDHPLKLRVQTLMDNRSRTIREVCKGLNFNSTRMRVMKHLTLLLNIFQGLFTSMRNIVILLSSICHWQTVLRRLFSVHIRTFVMPVSFPLIVANELHCWKNGEPA